jgi:hypothetical protein
MVTCNLAGKEVADAMDFKKTLKNHLLPLIDDNLRLLSVVWLATKSCNFSESIPLIVERCVAEVVIANERLPDSAANWTQTRVDCLKQQIADLNSTTNPVRKLIRKCPSTIG